MAAPVIKPRMVTLVIEGVLPANRKPVTAMQKVQRTMRMFMGVLLTGQRAAFPAIIALGRSFSNRVRTVLLYYSASSTYPSRLFTHAMDLA